MPKAAVRSRKTAAKGAAHARNTAGAVCLRIHGESHRAERGGGRHVRVFVVLFNAQRLVADWRRAVALGGARRGGYLRARPALFRRRVCVRHFGGAVDFVDTRHHPAERRRGNRLYLHHLLCHRPVYRVGEPDCGQRAGNRVGQYFRHCRRRYFSGSHHHRRVPAVYAAHLEKPALGVF